MTLNCSQVKSLKMMRKKRRPSVEKSESAAPPDVSKQMVFQKRLQQRLNKSPRYPGIVQEFIKGLESHIEDPERFRDCLLPVYHAWPMGPAGNATDHTAPRGAGHLALSNSLKCLISGGRELENCYMETSLCVLSVVQLCQLILGECCACCWGSRCCRRSGRDKELAGKLMQLVSIAPVEIQRDIINSLPEILEDSQHSDIASELNSLLQENTQLTMPSLD
ncbi:Fanconi anemia group D2 protein-like [Salvelinus sp. IW2-2015]|uniref:Fanconi anemia group D2 protein-like n=1 Tax=Salvelinus sp. IW2-2015 TaxID=2691554 RepID=UPI0038D48A29